MNISTATAQGQREYQEDRFVVSSMPGGKLIAVMDGHGGTEVSDRIANILPALWKKHTVFPESIYVTYHDYQPIINSIFGDLAQLTNNDDAGSTASLVFIPTASNEIYVAILGDSPVIVLDADGKVDVGPMHNARSNPAELAAAQARGASFNGNYIFTNYGGPGLQMTRALGDWALGPILDRGPEIYTRVVGPDSFVLVASDGLFDPSHRNLQPEIDAVVAQVKAGVSAQALVNRALALPTGDNVTAILVRFGNQKSRRKKKTVSDVAHELGGES